MNINAVLTWLQLPVPYLGTNLVAAAVGLGALVLIVGLMAWRPNKHSLRSNLGPAPHVDAQVHRARATPSQHLKVWASHVVISPIDHTTTGDTQP